MSNFKLPSTATVSTATISLTATVSTATAPTVITSTTATVITATTSATSFVAFATWSSTTLATLTLTLVARCTNVRRKVTLTIDLTFEDPYFDTDLSIHSLRFRDRIIDICTK